MLHGSLQASGLILRITDYSPSLLVQSIISLADGVFNPSLYLVQILSQLDYLRFQTYGLEIWCLSRIKGSRR